MNEWRAIRTLIAFELKREWKGVLFALLFALYFAIIYSAMGDAPKDDSSAARVLSGSRDWIYLFGLPIFENLMNRTCFGYWRDDPSTRRMAHWRTMPIPVRTIVTARHVQSVFLLIITGGLFIAVPCLMNPSWMSVGSGADWFPGGIVWIGYGLIAHMGCIYLELGFSGKTFMKWYLGFIGIMGAISVLLAWQGVSLYLEVLKLADKQPIWVPMAGVAVTALAMKLGIDSTVKRMQQRSYTF